MRNTLNRVFKVFLNDRSCPILKFCGIYSAFIRLKTRFFYSLSHRSPPFSPFMSEVDELLERVWVKFHDVFPSRTLASGNVSTIPQKNAENLLRVVSADLVSAFLFSFLVGLLTVIMLVSIYRDTMLNIIRKAIISNRTHPSTSVVFSVYTYGRLSPQFHSPSCIGFPSYLTW